MNPRLRLCTVLAGCLACTSLAAATPPPAGITYTNQVLPKTPWSVHIVRVPRRHDTFELETAHAGGAAIGLSTLTDQVKGLEAPARKIVVGLNGDFYERARAYAGDPRGVQITGGELLSAPNGGVAFWVGATNDLHLDTIQNRFEVVWPDGNKSAFGLNGERQPGRPELYTARVGVSTQTPDGRELVLEPASNGPWLPLQVGMRYAARIREVRDGGNTPLTPGVLVLSLSPQLAASVQSAAPGATLHLETATSPTMAGARVALGGGPILVRAGRRQRIAPPPTESYEFTSMLERHPRSAIGWNDSEFFFVLVDGRQKDLSVGMTLDELAAHLVRLGCREAMNLDGGGSATLWFNGAVRNSPCDGRERVIANSLLLVQRLADQPASSN